ncbi:MAG: hypothetical protein JOZ54_14025 [Acidobacteria bacterium]|nr:hypothetical protein [Acidobacteriota bacterium]
MSKDRLRDCAESGVSVFLGTADANGRPACCRAVALTSQDGYETVTVYAPVATAQETIANLATTRRIAIGLSRIPDHVSLQIKGVMRAVRLARPDEAPFVERQLEDFFSRLADLGLPRHVARRMNHWPAFAIDVSVEQVFDQTPGPNAGAAISS